MESGAFRDHLNSLSSKVQGRLLILGLACKANLPREAQHVLHRVVDAQSAGVVERRASLIILTAEQRLHAGLLELNNAHCTLETLEYGDASAVWDDGCTVWLVDTCSTSSERFFRPLGCRMAKWRKLQPHLSFTFTLAPWEIGWKDYEANDMHIDCGVVRYCNLPFDKSRATVFHAPQLVASSRGEWPLQSMLFSPAPWGVKAPEP